MVLWPVGCAKRWNSSVSESALLEAVYSQIAHDISGAFEKLGVARRLSDSTVESETELGNVVLPDPKTCLG